MIVTLLGLLRPDERFVFPQQLLVLVVPLQLLVFPLQLLVLFFPLQLVIPQQLLIFPLQLLVLIFPLQLLIFPLLLLVLFFLEQKYTLTDYFSKGAQNPVMGLRLCSASAPREKPLGSTSAGGNRPDLRAAELCRFPRAPPPGIAQKSDWGHQAS